jgi:hypothetical protein
MLSPTAAVRVLGEKVSPPSPTVTVCMLLLPLLVGVADEDAEAGELEEPG